MVYYSIDIETNPKITGRRNGSFTVKEDIKSFKNENDMVYFNDFFIKNRKDRDRIKEDTFEIFPKTENFEITYFPVNKSIKKLDFMFFAPFQLGVDFLVSYKAKQIVYDFNLPIHNKIPAKIDTFEDDYFLLGFPIWNFEIVDFSKSIFYHRDRGYFSFLNYEDYEKSESKYKYSTIIKLELNRIIKYDVIHIRGMVFFSENLLKELSLNNIMGYKVSDIILEVIQ